MTVGADGTVLRAHEPLAAPCLAQSQAGDVRSHAFGHAGLVCRRAWTPRALVLCRLLRG